VFQPSSQSWLKLHIIISYLLMVRKEGLHRDTACTRTSKMNLSTDACRHNDLVHDGASHKYPVDGRWYYSLSFLKQEFGIWSRDRHTCETLFPTSFPNYPAICLSAVALSSIFCDQSNSLPWNRSGRKTNDVMSEDHTQIHGLHDEFWFSQNKS